VSGSNREIERKFLVRPALLPADALGNGASFEQGYLATDPTVRVRRSERKGETLAFLTIKGPGVIDRLELEYAIPPEDARALLGLAKWTLTKVRHRIVVAAHTWDVDCFTGAHAGLWLAEIELARQDEPFEVPPWADREVSLDARYSNAALARAGRVP
jgi:adenylate cyclase